MARRDLPHEDIAVFPTLTFWYGLSFNELMAMPNWALRLYAESLGDLIAEYQGLLLTAAAFPWMKPAAQKALQKRLAAQQPARQRRPVTTQTGYRRRLLGMGFAFKDKMAPVSGDNRQ